ncbi:hypothetical protein BDA96_01G364900 [Sorghum bicolor]|uniref:Lon N-terminal domain-containing protein n=1 Tax=Sorghum bicolor TaxID=4558 RepID=A0A921UZY8_SORBI|nr:hypothetical protein BDA96_01G364900 [Sorghum bicolor]KAG0550753.1 hypothetical protein BDA96_01G364900 [Sorghum bicolor]
MALRTLHLPSKLARPNSHSFSPSSSPPHQPKLPPGPGPQQQTRVATATKQQQQQLCKRSTPLLKVKCRASLHDCMDEETVETPKDQTTEIPIVAYPSVVFPGATLQLQAFEFRHRIMMHTLLQQGLRFGVLCSAGKTGTGRMADVGCVVHVVECERLTDDRFFLTCVGKDRFRVIDIVRTKPYVVARIQVLLSDRHHSVPLPQGDLGSLMQQVEQQVKNVAMLSEKLNRKPLPYRQGDQLHRLHTAASLSFLVARLFIDDRLEQQTLLQMDDTGQRLVREGMYLERRSKYLAAIAAIKDAFQHLSCNEM